MRKIAGIIFVAFLLYHCGSEKNKQNSGLSEFERLNGIGPVKEPIGKFRPDSILAGKGEKIFQTRCTACHRLDIKLSAPPLRYVVKSRSNEYILNSILNPVEMAQRHPEAKRQTRIFGAQMTPQFLKESQAWEILHFLHFKAKEDEKEK